MAGLKDQTSDTKEATTSKAARAKKTEEEEEDEEEEEEEKDSDDSSNASTSSGEQRSKNKPMVVKETIKEMKYRKKNFKDPDEVIANSKLRCTSCASSLHHVVMDGREVYHHPVLKVLMCKSCIEFYGSGEISMDEDGSDKYCRWCGNGGTLYCCTHCSCAFCKNCIKRNFNRSIIHDVEKDDWKCFVCNGVPLWELRAICADAAAVSKRIRREKREENARNLKQLQKKHVPINKRSRRQNRWQKSKASSSGETDSEDDKSRTEKNKKLESKGKRKRGTTSSSGSEAGQKTKIEKMNGYESDIAVVVMEKECITVTDSDDEIKLPDEVDEEGGIAAVEMFTEHLNNLKQTGELIAYRSSRLLDKKVNADFMRDPKKVSKIVESMKLLVKLSGENMQHMLDFLTLHHEDWEKKTLNRHKKALVQARRSKNKQVKEVTASQEESNKSDFESKPEENETEGCKTILDAVEETTQEVRKRKRKSSDSDQDYEKESENIKKQKIDLNEDPYENGLDVSETIENVIECKEKQGNKSNSLLEGVSVNEDLDENNETAIEADNELNNSQVSFGSLTTVARILDYSDVDLFSDSLLKNEEVNVNQLQNEEANVNKAMNKNETKKDCENSDGEKSNSDPGTIEFCGDQEDLLNEDYIQNEIGENRAGDNDNDHDPLAVPEMEDKSGDESALKNNEIDVSSVACDDSAVKVNSCVSDAGSDNSSDVPLTEMIKTQTSADSSETDIDKTNKNLDKETKQQVENMDIEDSNSSDSEKDESKQKPEHSEECLEAQQALLGYTSDDEDEDKDEDEERSKKTLKRKDRAKKSKSDNVTSEENENKTSKIRRPGPKSKTRIDINSSSSVESLASDEESDTSSHRQQKKSENSKKRKFRLKDTEAYKLDKKLGWKCTTNVEKLSKVEFEKYYENYYSDEEDDAEKQAKKEKEIESLMNLKSLKKTRGKKSEENTEDSQSDGSDVSNEGKRKRKKIDKKKEQEQRLIDFFNKEDEDDDNDGGIASSNESESEKDVLKPMKKKEMTEKENEMAMKLLLGSSSDDDFNEQEDEPKEEEKKKKKKGKGKEEEKENNAEKDEETVVSEVEDGNTEFQEDTQMEVEEEKNNENAEIQKKEEEKKEKEIEDKNKEEEKEEKEIADKNKEEEKEEEEIEDKNKEKEIEDKNKEEEKEEKKIEDINDEKEKEVKEADSSDDSVKTKKKDWRKDKLLTEKLSDLDTSDEERLWTKKKEKEKKAEDSDSDMKNGLKKKPRRKKAQRRILGSDEDNDKDNSSSESESQVSSDSDIFVIKKKKRSAKKSNSDRSSDSDSDSDFKKKKPRRKRIKEPVADSSDDDDDDDGDKSLKSTPGKGRKKIHHILSDDNVTEATRRAAREEEERRKRIADKQKMYNEIFQQQEEGVEKVDKLVLDFDPETKKELVSVDPKLVCKLKPHQVKGVKFMWDACFESLKQVKKTTGSGCILAHCMGLGKTFQIVTLVHTLLNHKKTNVKTVLVVCPLTTVLNWVNEFNMWLKDGEEVNVFELTRYKQNYERMYQLKDWQECGGVMVLGYEMFRNLTSTTTKRLRKKAIETFQSTLVDPGPDLVVCDEGHQLKNEDSAIAKAMRRIRTLRRIVLTGTPLQNNLKEYHCMVQFVKPNLLGTRKEFLNRFVNPISNGQFEDSTPHDVKIMKRRAHVLHKMLEGSVQRFDYSVLTPFLPPKHEFVIFVRLTELQEKAYRHYLDFYSRASERNKGAQLFNDFNNLQRVWTHPRVLQMSTDKAEKAAERKRLMESTDSEGSLRDFIDDDSDEPSDDTTSNSSSEDSDVQVVNGEEEKPNKHKKYARSTRSKGLPEEPEEPKKDEGNEENEKGKDNSLVWWKQFFQGNEFEDMNQSGKLVLLFSILEECEKIGDKVLVFSQSLYSLGLIEYFLARIDAATQNEGAKPELCNHTGSWSPGLDYFRLDGSTSTENRNIWCKTFNREDNHRARLFIISTRAGGLGINLFAANRVIMFDASWNPSHDVQSIFRVFRFGQKKPCYIYRFLAQGTMEEKIYDRQVTKLSLSCRVVDEQQIERHYNMADLQELYRFDPEQTTKRPTPILPKDRLLAEMLKEHEKWIVTYHEHESLLENKEEEELNEEERKAAWEDYENEKQGKLLAQNLPQTSIPNVNMQSLREALRNENPTATDEELEERMNQIMGQLYSYVNKPANLQGQTYTAAQQQAYQKYLQQQQQQQRYIQAQQLRLQQERMAGNQTAGFNPNLLMQQYLREQPTSSYPTNVYRNTSVDKSGIFRVQPKLVLINPNSPGAPRALLETYQNTSQHASRQPVRLPQYPTVAHSKAASTSGAQNAANLQKSNVAVQDKTPVPENEIHTID